MIDCREPVACLSDDLEKCLIKSGKKSIWALSKVDLVPEQNSSTWLEYLSQQSSTVLIQYEQKGQKQTSDANRYDNKLSNECFENLTKAVKSIFGAKELKAKSKINVGVVGFPNVGKKTLIQSIESSAASDSKIFINKLSPGIVLS